jgi:hypothetical protein
MAYLSSTGEGARLSLAFVTGTRVSGKKPYKKAKTMKESTLAKITASVAAARGMAQKALASTPNPDWTEYEMRSIDEWIALQDVKLDRPEAIRRLVALGLDAKPK